jgi:hypothetical protein
MEVTKWLKPSIIRFTPVATNIVGCLKRATRQLMHRSNSGGFIRLLRRLVQMIVVMAQSIGG